MAKARIWAICGFLAASALLAARGGTASDYSSARRKIEMIQQDRLPRGSRVTLSQNELNAYVRHEVPQVAPQGVRDPRVELGKGKASGFAYIDFPKLREAQGVPMNWIFARLLAGERPVRVDARIRSAGGRATVDVDSVQISGLTISGSTLDYLIHNYLHSYFPSAKVGEPFELAHRIERLDVQPAGVNVVIGK